MKKRQIKKQAKNFLAGRKTRGVAYSIEERRPNTDGTVLIIERIPVSAKIVKAVYDAMGGVPCHWDSPFIIDIWFDDEMGVA